MTDRFNVVRQDAVLEVVFVPPFCVALDANSRGALVALLTTPPQNIKAVVIRAGTHVFSGGLDLPGEDDAMAPDLAQVCASVEGCAIPVIFLLEGIVAGALAEVALAADVRLATPEGRMVLGALALGMISGAGGTQRLAAQVGAEHALRLMRSGQAVTAPEAVALGLVDQVIEAKRRVAGHALVRELAEHWSARTVVTSPRDARGFLASAAEARLAARGMAGRALVDCIEAAILLPRAQGLAFEAAVATDLAASPEAAALCHIYRAERQAAKQANAAPAAVARLALIGAQTVLVPVVLAALTRGVGVVLLEADREALVGFLKAIAARQEAAVQAGQLTESQRDAAWALLTPVTDAAALGPCDLAIAQESAGPSLGSCPVLLTGQTPLPEGALRLVLAGRVAELGLPLDADTQPAALAMGFLRRLGLIVVLTGAQDGQGISGRLALASGAALRGVLALGVSPDTISAALTEFGLAAPSISDAADLPPRTMAADEVVNRILGAMANEGAQLLATGMAHSALDVDLVAVHGLGFPRLRGGPLHQAEVRGLLVVRRDLTLWADEAEVWRPVPALDTFVSVGRGFEAPP